MYSIDPTLRRNYLGNVLPLSVDAGIYYVTSMTDSVTLADASAVNTIISWSSEYILPSNVQTLVVQYAADAIGVGNAQDNVLIADGANNYTLVGGGGNDVLIGNGSGGQFDTGAGSTTFVIAKGDGNDVISNFRPGIDVVRLYNFDTLAGYPSVAAAMTQVGADAVLNLGAGQTLTFRNTTVAAFKSRDFALPAYLPGMTLRFDDEFNTFVSSPNGSKGWMTQGGNVWRTLSGNGELEYYSDSSVGVNPFSLSNGALNITAAPGTNPLGLPYNSGIITTEGSYNFEYGLVEVNAKLPAGAGLWPAIWMVPSNFGWPPEIDIMEMLGNNPTVIYASTHSGPTNVSSTTPVYVGDTSTAFHTYGLDWEPNTITWYFDGTAILTLPTPSDMHQPMYLLINLAVGGGWPGPPQSASEFPAQMSIDWVRIYGSANTTALSGTAVLPASTPVTISGTGTASGTGGTASAPVVAAVTTSPGNGSVLTGGTVAFTVLFSSQVTVAGGAPVLSLSDGGTATYTSGSGSTALVFTYTAAAGDVSGDLMLAASNAISLNGATIRDSAGNNAVLTGANGYNPAGTLLINPTINVSNTSTYIAPGFGSFGDASGNIYSIDNAGNAIENGTPIPNGDSTGAMVISNNTVYGEYLTTGQWYTWNQVSWAGTVPAPVADTTSPTIVSIVTSPGSGQVTTGGVVTLTVKFSESVSVAGGTPSLLLNDGGTATYVSGSGGATLTFGYTAAAGQSTSDLALAASNALALNGATIRDAAGNDAVLTAANGYNPAGTLQVSTAAPPPPPAPVVSSIVTSPGSGQITTGGTVQLTVTFSSPVTVAGGTPSLLLNDGGTAAYVSGSGGTALTFSHTVVAGQSSVDLALAANNAVALNGATIRDATGNNAVLTAANGYNPAGILLVSPPSAPVITSIVTSPGSGQITTGGTVQLTVTFSSPVTVAGGTPGLLLNDGGTAAYVSGSGGTALTFRYTVTAAQNTADLALAALNAVALNGATIRDASGTNAVLTAANGYNPAGALVVDTLAPTIASIATSPGSGQVAVGGIVTLTVTFSEAVTVAGGTPSLLLNDGGTATYVSGSGGTALTFSYTALAGQNTADLALAASNAVALNGATIRDAAGNNALLTAANGYNPAGTLQVSTPVIPANAIALAVSGWGNTYKPGAGLYAVAGTASAANITLGDGNQTVNITGMNDTVSTGNGNEAISLKGNNDTIVTGTGSSNISIAGNFANVSVGGTGTGTTTVTATGYGETITSTAPGNVNVTGPTGGSTVTLGDGNQSVVLGGGYNTVTVGVGTSTITSGATGQSTVHTAGGSATIFASAWNNVLDAGAGMNFLHGGSGNDRFVANGAGQGLDTIFGFTSTNNDVLDLSRTLASVASAVDLSNVGLYITATSSGGNTTLFVDTTGGHGTPYAFATLNGMTTTVAGLIAHNQLIVP